MRTTVHTIVYVSDLKRSIEFYREVFDITVTSRTDDWAEFVAGGATLVLLKSEQPLRLVPSDVATFPSACHLGVETDDLDGFHSKIMAYGTKCIQPPIKQNAGDRIAMYSDPDGLVIHVTEPDKVGV